MKRLHPKAVQFGISGSHIRQHKKSHQITVQHLKRYFKNTGVKTDTSAYHEYLIIVLQTRKETYEGKYVTVNKINM